MLMGRPAFSTNKASGVRPTIPTRISYYTGWLEGEGPPLDAFRHSSNAVLPNRIQKDESMKNVRPSRSAYINSRVLVAFTFSLAALSLAVTAFAGWSGPSGRGVAFIEESNEPRSEA